MNHNPFSTLIVLNIENTAATVAERMAEWNALWDILEQPTALKNLAARFPYRAAGSFFARKAQIPSRFYQNPFYPEDACCGLRLGIEDGKIRLTTNLGGEWLVADHVRGDFIMLYKTKVEGEEVLQQDFNDGQQMFHNLRPQDLLKSGAAINQFNEARKLAGYSAQMIAALRDTGRTRAFEKLSLGS